MSEHELHQNRTLIQFEQFRERRNAATLPITEPYRIVFSPDACLSASLPSYIDTPLMISLYCSPSFVTRITRMYASGRPCASWVRWSSSGPQTIPKVLPTFSLQGKVSSNIFFSRKKHVIIQVTGLPRDRSCSGTWERVLSRLYAVVSIPSQLLQMVRPLRLCKGGVPPSPSLISSNPKHRKPPKNLLSSQARVYNCAPPFCEDGFSGPRS